MSRNVIYLLMYMFMHGFVNVQKSLQRNKMLSKGPIVARGIVYVIFLS